MFHFLNELKRVDKQVQSVEEIKSQADTILDLCSRNQELTALNEKLEAENDEQDRTISELTMKLGRYEEKYEAEEQIVILSPRLDPDPYGLHGLTLSQRLEAMRINPYD